jgi:hypothetical protein
MSDESLPRKQVLHRVRGVEAVRVQRNLEFRRTASRALGFDLYAPLRPDAARRAPVVVIVGGYPDPGFEALLGCRFKEMGQVASWARLIAASGIAAIAYANEEPASDLHALLAHLRENATSLGIDPERVGVFACSGNVPLALSLLFRGAGEVPTCAALLYGFTLDLDGATAVADAAKMFGFVNPGAGRGLDALARGVPLLLVRAGRDSTPGLNDSLDRFVARALDANLPVAVANHAEGVHAFDLYDAGPESRTVIEQTLAFLRTHLYPGPTTVNRG